MHLQQQQGKASAAIYFCSSNKARLQLLFQHVHVSECIMQVRVWDVRKAGCMELCDQQASYTPATLRSALLLIPCLISSKSLLSSRHPAHSGRSNAHCLDWTQSMQCALPQLAYPFALTEHAPCVVCTLAASLPSSMEQMTGHYLPHTCQQLKDDSTDRALRQLQLARLFPCARCSCMSSSPPPPKHGSGSQQGAAGRKRLKRRVSQDDGATAHDGAVTGLAPTLEGLSWLSAGTDSRVRMWDSVHYR